MKFTSLRHLLLVLTVAFSSSATSQETYDLRDYTFAGVKSGDPTDAAIEALKEHFSISEDELNIVLNLARTPRLATIRKDDIKMELSFASDREKILEGKIVTYFITYWRNSDYEAEIQKLNEKYGKATFITGVEYDRVRMKWCGSLNEAGDDCGLNSYIIIFTENSSTRWTMGDEERTPAAKLSAERLYFRP